MKSNEDDKSRRRDRCNCTSRFSEPFPETTLNLLAGYYIFFQHILTYESLFVMIMAAGGTAFYVLYNNDEDQFIASKLDFSLLSIAIVFPLHFLLDQTFMRREEALSNFAKFKAVITNVAMAQLNWDFPSVITGKYNGREYLPIDFEKAVLENTFEILHLIQEYLVQPTALLHQNLVFKKKIVESCKQKEIWYMKRLLGCVDRSYLFVEIMKERGLPPNEASRINHYNLGIHNSIEELRNFKWYRTPHATKAFGLVYITLLPWFYGPYYAWVAGRVTKTVFSVSTGVPIEIETTSATNVAFAILLSLITSIVLIGLIAVQQLLEDPFTKLGIDSIDVESDLVILKSIVKQQYELANARQTDRLDFARVYDAPMRYSVQISNDGVIEVNSFKRSETCGPNEAEGRKSKAFIDCTGDRYDQHNAEK